MHLKPLLYSSILLVLPAFLWTTTCSKNNSFHNTENKIYKAHKAKSTMVIDGKMNEEDWTLSEVRPLKYFYPKQTGNTLQKTDFRMMWDNDNIYLFFECEDQYLTARETKRDGAPYLDDCAEIFLIPAPEPLNAHMCFEINILNTKNDVIYVNDFYKGQGNVIKSWNPDYEIGIQTDGTINDNSDIDRGWTMEFAIPISVFNKFDQFFPIKTGTRWSFLAIRQDRNVIEAETRSCTTIFPVENINTKDVHQPDMFGIMEFTD